jgi:hypothetical protein
MICSLAVVSSLLVASPLLFASPGWADSPAAIADSGDTRARTSFERFAGEWMARVHRLEDQQRENPSVRPGAIAPMITYRGYGDDYSIELRPTGHAAAPYIGLLRYTEHLYSCIQTADCTVASSVPVTEIFRFQGGRWIY